MEAVTALPFTKIRHHSSPITAANFYWTFTVVRQFSEHISSINSFNPLSNFSEKILLPFFRWVNWGTEGCITRSNSHRELGIVKQGKWHEVPYAIVSILLCLLLLQPSPSGALHMICALIQTHSYSLSSKVYPMLMHCYCSLSLLYCFVTLWGMYASLPLNQSFK